MSEMSPIHVIERSDTGDLISKDIYSRLLEDRIIILQGDLEVEESSSIIAQLLYLSSLSYDPISIYINSEGGGALEALAIYDTMRFVKPIIKTFCIGQACSAAAILLASGSKGYRSALPNSRIHLHQVRGGISGTNNEMRAYSSESERVMTIIYNILFKHTGQSVSRIKKDLSEELFLTPEDAERYGLIDYVIKEQKDI